MCTVTLQVYNFKCADDTRNNSYISLYCVRFVAVVVHNNWLTICKDAANRDLTPVVVSVAISVVSR